MRKKQHNTPEQKITKAEFLATAPQVLRETGLCSEQEINSIIALTLQLERAGVQNHLQEL